MEGLTNQMRDEEKEIKKALGSKIKRLRKGAKLTQQSLSLQCGVTRPAVGQWESGSTSPSLEMLTRIANILGVTRSALLDESDLDMPINPATASMMVPEIDWTQAGSLIYGHDDRSRQALAWHPKPNGASEETFVLKVIGESMISEYQPGTFIYVDPLRTAQSGNDVVVVLADSDESTFRRYLEEPGFGKHLKALNPEVMSRYTRIDSRSAIVGVVIADMRIREL